MAKDKKESKKLTGEQAIKKIQMSEIGILIEIAYC